MKINKGVSSFIIIIVLFLTSCSIVTTYGKLPEPDISEKDKFTFKIYYNAFSSKSDCDYKAKEEIDKFKNENDYLDYTIINSYNNYSSYVYVVKFYSSDSSNSVNITETEVRKYYDDNLYELDIVEGIWTDFSGKYKIAIKKNNNISKCDYIGFIIHSDYPSWQNGDIKVELSKTASKNIYSTNYYLKDKSKVGTTSIINDNCILEIPVNNFLTSKFLKNYPIPTNINSNVQDKSVVTGSGSIISESGLVVTNYHVIENKTEISVILPQQSKEYSAELILKDKNNDLAILRLQEFRFSEIFSKPIPFAISTSSSSKLGEDIFTLGFPLGEILGKSAKFSSGKINSLFGIQDDPRVFQISNPIQPGNSGGPLFNSNGEFIGIVFSSLNAKFFYENADIIPQNVNFAVKSNYLLNLISLLPDEKEISERANLLSSLPIEKQIELIQPFIVNVKAK